MPLQQHSTAVVRGALKALVDVLHQQVHPVLVQRLHGLLNVVGFEGDEHLQHDALSTVLSTQPSSCEAQPNTAPLSKNLN